MAYLSNMLGCVCLLYFFCFKFWLSDQDFTRTRPASDQQQFSRQRPSDQEFSRPRPTAAAAARQPSPTIGSFNPVEFEPQRQQQQFSRQRPSGNLYYYLNRIGVLWVLLYPASCPNHTSYRKIYFNEFVANVLCDNMGIIIFDLRGCGGC